ncbi:MAG: hypothetical protein ACXVB0_05375 [Mucilaginibacter sp.]
MKNLRFLLFAAFYVLISCSKDNTVAPNTITATISGSTGISAGTEKFTIRVEVTKNPGNPSGYQYGIGLTAFNADPNKAEDIGIYLYSANPITAGIYKFADNKAFLSFAINPSDFDYISDETQSNPATITITSISGNNVKGTFSGTLKGTNDRFVTIADGKFNVNF